MLRTPEARARMAALVKEMEGLASVPADAEIKGVFGDAYLKYRGGAEKHGELDIENDPRDFLFEAERELLDAIVYINIDIVKIRKLRKILDEFYKRMTADEGELTG